ncbi:MAG: ion channel [Cyanobacteria bacterium P01_H01_bin.15]
MRSLLPRWLNLRSQPHQQTNEVPKLPKRVWIRWRNGKFEFDGAGDWRNYLNDPYHLLLTVPWVGFVVVMGGLYLGLNLFFAVLFWLGGDVIANARENSFVDAFFFSVQTFSTIGYGALYPDKLYAQVLATSEAFVGLLGVAIMTGLAFARFSQPTAKVVFSKHMAITEYNGLPTLMFRAANQRRNQLLEAQMKIYYMRDEVTAEGEFMRRLRSLSLTQSDTPAFIMTWTLMHPIDENSPLYGENAESLIQKRGMFIISLTGVDETVGHSMHARYNYAAHDVKFDHRLVDIIVDTASGHRYIDFTRFHTVEPSANCPTYAESRLRQGEC